MTYNVIICSRRGQTTGQDLLPWRAIDNIIGLTGIYTSVKFMHRRTQYTQKEDDDEKVICFFHCRTHTLNLAGMNFLFYSSPVLFIFYFIVVEHIML